MSTPEPPSDWLATTADVAALLRARTKDANGNELGMWSDETRPTESEVQLLIDLASGELVGDLGPGVACTQLCRAAIAYRASCLIELSYFPEQVRSSRSAYDELRVLADEAATALGACIAGGDGGAGQAGGEGYSYHSLPVRSATLVAAEANVWRHPEYPATWQRACIPPSTSEPALVDEPDYSGPYYDGPVIGYPAEGDPDRGLPPIIPDEQPPT
jgi:hypothetical protein